MTAKMWRLARGAVRIKGSVMYEMPGTARGAISTQDSHWILSDKVGPLALIGKQTDIAQYMQQRGDDIMRNDTDPKFQMTDIGVAVSRSMYSSEVTSDQVRHLNPVGDATVAIVNGLTSFLPGTDAGDFISAAADLYDAGQTVTVGEASKTNRPGDDLQVTFWVVPEGSGMATNSFTHNGSIVRGLPLSKFANGIADGLTNIV